MKSQVSPGTAAAVIVVILLVIGGIVWWTQRSPGAKPQDAASMPGSKMVGGKRIPVPSGGGNGN